MVAFPLGDRTDDPVRMYLVDINTLPVNIAGLPAMSIPCGFANDADSDKPLPVGLQLIGPTSPNQPSSAPPTPTSKPRTGTNNARRSSRLRRLLVIVNFRHNGFRRFYEKGERRRVPPQYADKIHFILTRFC